MIKLNELTVTREGAFLVETSLWSMNPKVVVYTVESIRVLIMNNGLEESLRLDFNDFLLVYPRSAKALHDELHLKVVQAFPHCEIINNQFKFKDVL